jgi:hypothetical protein
MAVSLVAALPLLVVRATRNLPFALFLAEILLLSAASILFGIRALTAKKPGGDYPLERLGAVVFLAGSVAFIGYAVWARAGVSIFFGVLGASLAVAWLRFFRNPYREKQAWFLMHITGMCTAAIAATTAFVVVNVGHFGVPPELRWIGWTAPPVLGTVGIAIWTRYYRARFSGGAAVG